MERQIENKHGDGRRERSKTTHRAHETVNHFGTKDFRSSLVIPMHMDMFRGKYALTINKHDGKGRQRYL